MRLVIPFKFIKQKASNLLKKVQGPIEASDSNSTIELIEKKIAIKKGVVRLVIKILIAGGCFNPFNSVSAAYKDGQMTKNSLTTLVVEKTDKNLGNKEPTEAVVSENSWIEASALEVGVGSSESNCGILQIKRSGSFIKAAFSLSKAKVKMKVQNDDYKKDLVSVVNSLKNIQRINAEIDSKIKGGKQLYYSRNYRDKLISTNINTLESIVRADKTPAKELGEFSLKKLSFSLKKLSDVSSRISRAEMKLMK